MVKPDKLLGRDTVKTISKMSGIITFIAGMLGASESGTRLLLSLFSGKVLVVAVAGFPRGPPKECRAWSR